MIDVVVFQNISILRKKRMFCFEISDFCFGDGDPEKKETLTPPMHYLTKSWAWILLRISYIDPAGESLGGNLLGILRMDLAEEY